MTGASLNTEKSSRNVILTEQLNILKPRLEDYLRATGWRKSLRLEDVWRNICADGEPFLSAHLKDYPKVILIVTSGVFQHIFEYDASKEWRVLALDLSFWEARTGQSTLVN